jgi:hypothetical protein
MCQFIGETTDHLVGGALCGAGEKAAKNKVRMFLSPTITARTAEGKLEPQVPVSSTPPAAQCFAGPSSRL